MTGALKGSNLDNSLFPLRAGSPAAKGKILAKNCRESKVGKPFKAAARVSPHPCKGNTIGHGRAPKGITRSRERSTVLRVRIPNSGRVIVVFFPVRTIGTPPVIRGPGKSTAGLSSGDGVSPAVFIPGRERPGNRSSTRTPGRAERPPSAVRRASRFGGFAKHSRPVARRSRPRRTSVPGSDRPRLLLDPDRLVVARDELLVLPSGASVRTRVGDGPVLVAMTAGVTAVRVPTTIPLRPSGHRKRCNVPERTSMTRRSAAAR